MKKLIFLFSILSFIFTNIMFVSNISAAEFSDNFESYDVGVNPTEVYDFIGFPWGPSDPQPVDLYQVGMLNDSKVLQYYFDGPCIHFPFSGKLYKEKYISIDEAHVTFYRTQHTMGYSGVIFEYQDSAHYYSIDTSWDNKLYISQNRSIALGSIDLWPDTFILNLNQRIEVKRVGDKLLATIVRLDTNDSKSLEVTATQYSGGQVGFGAFDDWAGGIYINIDDFYVKGTLPALVTPTLSDSTPQYGDTVCVQVDVADVTDLYAASFDVNYNPAVLDYTGTTEGTFLSADGQVTTTLQASVLDGDESTGQIVVGLSRLGEVAGVTGSGNLATLCFTVIGDYCSTSDITFGNAVLEGPAEGSEIITAWNGSTLTVTLSAPMDLSTSDPGLHNRIDLCWDAVPGATLYEIYRSNSAGGTYIQINTTTNTCYQDTACIIPTLDYYYMVRAVTNEGSCVSEYSVEVAGFTAGLLGDINNDGRVNGRDLSILARAFGASCGEPRFNCQADLNRDCFIDGDDLSLLAANFGMKL